jgi:hypothetical protein
LWLIPQVPHLRVRERGHPIKGWVATAQRMIASLRRVSGQNVVLSEVFTFSDALALSVTPFPKEGRNRDSVLMDLSKVLDCIRLGSQSVAFGRVLACRLGGLERASFH